MSSASSLSCNLTDVEQSTKIKWDILYTLRARIIQFIVSLEKRTKLYPPPFHRFLVGEDAKLDQLSVRYSEKVSQCASDYILDEFNDRFSLA